jgi:tRNA(fMet)-specific endonuclease VapC
MNYLLDTNTCIGYLRAPLSLVAQKLAAISIGDVAISAVTAVELYRGAHRSL